MWAYHLYNTVPHNPEIIGHEAAALLENLAPDEHVELLLRARLRSWSIGEPPGTKDEWARRLGEDNTEELIHPEEFEGGPTGLAVRTLERLVFLTPGTGKLVDHPLREGNTVGNRGGTEYAPSINWASTISYGDAYIQLFTPTEDIIEILEEGAGSHILRLPAQPGVPPVPTLAEPYSTDENTSWGPMGYLTGWEAAENLAEFHLKYLGFSNVRRTKNGADEGIDISGNNVAAQVKMTALPVGRPVIQQLVGATSKGRLPLCYSTSGYTKEADSYAGANGVALFLVEPNGDVRAANVIAKQVETTQPSNPDAHEWRKAYTYRDEAIVRLNDFVNGQREYEGGYESRIAKRRLGYLIGSLKMLLKESDFATPRELVIHFHHAEQLAAVAAQNYEQPYPTPPSQSRREASVSDFY